jgi:hypothetical protein
VLLLLLLLLLGPLEATKSRQLESSVAAASAVPSFEIATAATPASASNIVVQRAKTRSLVPFRSMVELAVTWFKNLLDLPHWMDVASKILH